jgi:putative membrane protein
MKLHPLSVPYRTAQWLVQIGPMLAFGAIAGGSAGDGRLAILASAAVFLLAAGAVAAWQTAYYRRYEYELTEDTFDIFSGVLSRREREIPYDRIQNVSIDRSVFQRFVGLATVELETAGGEGAEAALRYVSEDEAKRLQDELSERKRTSNDRSTSSASENQDLVYEITRPELALLGVVSFDIRLVPFVVVSLSTVSQQFESVFLSTGFLVATAPLIGLGLYLVSAAFSGLYAMASFYGFRLWRSTDEVRYERGLFQRSSGTIPLKKIQTLFISENVLKRIAGYATLQVETAGFWPGEGGGSRAAVPIAKRDRIEQLARDIEPYESIEFERPPKRARQRYAVRYLLVIGVLVAAGWAGTVLTEYSYPWYAVALLVLFVPVAAHLKWTQRGYALLDSHVVTRNGFWSRRTDIVPYHRIQTVIASQTIFQRNRNLATLTIDTAGTSGLTGNDGRAVDIDADVAGELREAVAGELLDSLEQRRQQTSRRRREQLLGGGPTGSGPSTGSPTGSDR